MCISPSISKLILLCNIHVSELLILGQLKDHFKAERTNFNILLKSYQDPFQLKLGNLPNLLTYPKALPYPHKTLFLLRDYPLVLFKQLEQWSNAKQVAGDPRKGFYLAGPNGVGKSVIIYTLACLAKAHNWIVLYIPRCDEWAAKNTSRESKDYLLHAFAAALVQYYDNAAYTATDAYKTWGEQLLFGLSTSEADKDTVLSDIIDGVCNQDTIPVLFLFDEVNFLFTDPLPWSLPHLAKNGPYFANLAASISRLHMKRGWKVLSGTGHQQFLKEVPSGLTDAVRYLIPFDYREFTLLMNSGIINAMRIVLLW